MVASVAVCVCVCVSYCRQYNWTHGRPVLVRPYDTTFMFYESMTDGHHWSVSDVYEWLTDRLSQHIHSITSLTELQHDWLDSTRHTQHVNVIICHSHSASSTPLFLAVLSVLLDSRVRFARVPQSIAADALTLAQPQQSMSVIISTSELTYIYGSADADCMTLAAVRLLLTLLAPSAADLRDFAVTLSLLLVCLEPCLVSSGLKSRLISVVLLSLQLCFVCLLYCFFVSYVIPEHELHLLLSDLLPVWRYITLTSFGDLFRSDCLRYTIVNFDVFFLTYFLYLLLVAWFYGRLCRQRRAWLTSYWRSVLDEDVDNEYIGWYVWQQFGLADYWLDSQPAARSCSLSVQSDNAVKCCTHCGRSLSYGCKVCMLACQHVFHHSCLAELSCSHDCVCPACRCPVYDCNASTSTDCS